MSIEIDEIEKIAIERKPFDGEVHDLMDGAARWEGKVHDHGLVALLGVMPGLGPGGGGCSSVLVVVWWGGGGGGGGVGGEGGFLWGGGGGGFFWGPGKKRKKK